jgi:hypothetical protein
MEKVKAVYIHNPKTAGKTLYKSLAPVVVRARHLHNSIPKHCTASYYVESKWYNPDLPMISSTRNPWARAVSLFRYLRSINKISKNISFEKWVYNPKAPGHCLDPYDRNPLQLETFVKDPEGNTLVSHIIRLEDLHEDYKNISEELGLPVLKIKTYKSSLNGKGKNFREMYTPEMVDYIAELCKWEIETFGYSF